MSSLEKNGKPDLILAALPTGPAAATTIAAGVGTLILGVATLLAKVSPAVKAFLTWYVPLGPLSGRFGVTLLAWLAVWLWLGRAWGYKQVRLQFWWPLALTMTLTGLLLMFPPFIRLFIP